SLCCYFCLTLYCSTLYSCFAFFQSTSTTEIYTLSLHDALPISSNQLVPRRAQRTPFSLVPTKTCWPLLNSGSLNCMPKARPRPVCMAQTMRTASAGPVLFSCCSIPQKYMVFPQTHVFRQQICQRWQKPSPRLLVL